MNEAMTPMEVTELERQIITDIRAGRKYAAVTFHQRHFWRNDEVHPVPKPGVTKPKRDFRRGGKRKRVTVSGS